MAQNVTVAGASYSDVPSVVLPKTGGGSASFTDVTDTTAAASDVANGKYFYTAAGVRTAGTNPGGGVDAGQVYQDENGYVVLDDDAGGRYDTSDATATASDILATKTAYGASGKVTGNIATKTQSDLTASGATVTVPAGYYASQATKSVASGSASTPATSITANPSISVNSTTGLITATASATKSVTPTVSAGYVSSGTAGTITVSGSNTSQLSTQAGTTVTPTESEQTAVAAGKYTTGAVKVGAISSTYVGSGIDRNDSTDLTASGATVSVPAGYYATNASKSVASGSATAPATISGTSATVSTGTNTLTLTKTVSVTPTVSAGYVSSGTSGNSTVSLTASVNTRSSSDLTASGGTITAPAGYYASNASKSVASGTEGTPTATKGTVSSHSVTVTPSVTNVAGYIAGGTHSGTAVTVSASELVSGSETKTTNGTYDVTNLAQVVVNVSGSAGLVYETGTWTPTEDIADYTISFTNTHTTAPFYYMVSDAEGDYSGLTNSNLMITVSNMYDVFGAELRPSDAGHTYARTTYIYIGTNGASVSGTSLTSLAAVETYITNTGIRATTIGTSRYWRSGRAYKWIAVWKPTS